MASSSTSTCSTVFEVRDGAAVTAVVADTEDDTIVTDGVRVTAGSVDGIVVTAGWVDGVGVTTA